MKIALTIAMALLLLSIEAVIVKYAGLRLTRIDVTVVLIAFLALRASTQVGAVSAFAIGYLLDLMTGRPTGLYTFLAVLIFLLGRLAASLVDVRSAGMFAIFVMASDLGHGLLAFLFSWLTAGKQAGVAVMPLGGLPMQVLLTGVAAVALYPLLRRIDPGNERPEAGYLR